MRYLVLLLAMVLPSLTAACQEVAPRELNLYNWENYLAPGIIEGFEAEFGIQVNLEYFDSEEAMLSAVQSDPSRYDLVITSDSMVSTLIDLKLLAPLDLKEIPNFENVAPSFKDLPHDPENAYSVPYLWGTMGMALNTEFIPRDTPSWEVLWDADYSGKIAMLADPYEVVGAALKLLGYSLNSSDPAELEAAREKLLEQRPLLAGYLDPLTIYQRLVSGELWAAQLYSGDALAAARERDTLIYVLPREGSALWIDNLVIPAEAQHKEEAAAFINYILRPEVGGAISSYLWYANPNLAARQFMAEEVLKNPAVYPDEELLTAFEFFLPRGKEADAIINRIWAELQRAE